MGPFNFFPVSTYLILILSDTHDPLEIVLQPLNKFSFTLSFTTCLCLSRAWQMVNSFLLFSSFTANILFILLDLRYQLKKKGSVNVRSSSQILIPAYLQLVLSKFSCLDQLSTFLFVTEQCVCGHAEGSKVL